MSDMTLIVQSMGRGISLMLEYWWIWVPLLLGFAAYETWFEYQRVKYLLGLQWTVLELIPPPEIPFSSPKAAEHIFAGLHAAYGSGTGWKDQFFQGKVPDWFSFEMVSNGGESHFYIRCPEKQRNVIEALIFAQYPESEIRIVPDYIDILPAALDLAAYDVAGAELEFTKESAYPIKTYLEFEEAGGKDEYARLDPLAPLVEIMSALGPGEHLWLQYILRPTGGDWAKEGEKVADKLKGKKEEKKFPLDGLFAFIEGLFGVFAAEKKEEKKEEKKDDFNLQKLTPAEKVVLEQVQYKLARLAFKTGIRLVYAARKDAFNGSRIASATAMFKQLYATNLNTFKPGNHTRDKGILNWVFPGDKGFFADERAAKKKAKMYAAYRQRSFPKKDRKELLVILSTDELATLWHLPGLNVKAPLMPRVQAKKGQPPAILPTR